MPAAGAFPRVDRGEPGGDGHAAGGHAHARLAAPRQAQALGQVAHEGEAGQESEHVHQVLGAAVQGDDVVRADAERGGHLGEVGRGLALVAHRQAPVAAVDRRAVLGGVDQRLQCGEQGVAVGGERVEEHRQRAEGGHGLDHARQRARLLQAPDGGVERVDRGEQGGVDDAAELDGERGVAGVENAKTHGGPPVVRAGRWRQRAPPGRSARRPCAAVGRVRRCDGSPRRCR